MVGFSLRLFKNFVLRDIRRNLVRTFLTVAGIALGVAVFLAISIANDTALARFRQTVAQVAGKANLELLPLSAGSMDEGLLEDLSFLGGVGVKWTSIIDEHLVVKGASGQDEVIQIIGIDMLADPEFKRYEESDDGGSGDAAASTSGDASGSASAVESSVFAPDSVLVGASLAERLHLKKGSTFTCLLPEGERILNVAGVMSKSGLGGAYSGNLIVADMPLAQVLTGLEGRVSRVDMIVGSGKENTGDSDSGSRSDDDQVYRAVSEKLRQIMPSDIMIGTPETRSNQAEKMTRSFEYNLLALTLIALMVGMFLIYNTMTITVLRRRPEIGVMRALGVKRSTILNMFLWETIFIGGLGTTCGVVLGGFLAQGALAAVAQTFQYFYFKVPLEKVSPAPEQYLLAAAIGMGLTLTAALPPLLESTTVAPAEATKRASFESRLRFMALPLFIMGLVCLALCYLSSLQGPVLDFPFFGYLAALLAIVGASLLMPLALSRLLPGLSRLLGHFMGAKGRVAASSLSGTLSRTAVACASLMIGIAMMISLAIMISSFRKTVTQWIDQSFQADLWMQSQARAAGNKGARLPESVVKECAAVKGVAAAEGFVDRRIIYEGMPVFLAAADFDVLAKYGNQLFLSGETNEAVCNRMSGSRAIISEPFAVRRKLKKGDVLKLDVGGVSETFTVEDIYYDYASDLGYIIIPRDVYKNLYKDSTVSNVAIYLQPGADLAAVKSELMSRLSGARLAINSTMELRKQAIVIFDRTFAITYALHTIAVIVSMLSVMNALFALTIESKREFAILRYLGAGRSQLAAIVYTQAAILATVGNIGGLGLGYILSLLLTHVINKQSFGWSVQYSIPYDFIVQSSILVVATAVASACLPARLAASTLAPAVIRDE
ncbi:MAG: ABC transporter permease [Candidatus Melainabacteria bacterium]|nr:ABC transporter permease [Candidatus Melainabacteria bacterium]